VLSFLNLVATLPCDLLLIVVHVLGCCCFSDINISQGSVATHLRDDGIFYYRSTTNLQSVGERILKIGQYLAKLRGKNIVAPCFPDTVYI